jgi:hypothetical protein
MVRKMEPKMGKSRPPKNQSNNPLLPAKPAKGRQLPAPRVPKDDSQDQVYPDGNPTPPHNTGRKLY